MVEECWTTMKDMVREYRSGHGRTWDRQRRCPRQEIYQKNLGLHDKKTWRKNVVKRNSKVLNLTYCLLFVLIYSGQFQ